MKILPSFYVHWDRGPQRRFLEFPKFPEMKVPEGKDASEIKRLAIDPVRLGKKSKISRGLREDAAVEARSPEG